MRNLGSYKPAVLSFTHVTCAIVYPINHILVMYALAHGEDVSREGGIYYRAVIDCSNVIRPFKPCSPGLPGGPLL